MIHPPPQLTLTAHTVLSAGASVMEIDLRTNRPVKVWSDGCEWGYDALVLLVRDSHHVVHRVARRPVSWRKNVPTVLELVPGQTNRYTVISNFNAEWPDAARVSGRRSFAFEYAIPNDRESQDMGVWNGRIRSPWIRFR